MKKLLTKLTATIFFLSVFLSFTQPGIASPLSDNTIIIDEGKNTNDDVSIQSKTLWEKYLSAVFYISGSIAERAYNTPAKYVSIPGAVGSTTGTIQYSKTNAFANTTVNFDSYYDTIYAFGNPSAGNSNSKIGIAIYRKSNFTMVASGNVYGNEGVSAGRMSSGDYQIVYNIHDPVKWDLGVFYFINSPPCTQCLPTNEPQPLGIEDELNDTLLTNSLDNKILFTTPQQEAFKKDNTKSKTKKSILTIDELLNEMFDEELKEYVHSLKNFNSGDPIIISDSITDIYYDGENQTTSFGFNYSDRTNSEISKVYWKFAGDLRNQFSIGDSVSFNTEVVSIDKDLNLESLDILGYVTKGTPNIETYLLSHLKKNDELWN